MTAYCQTCGARRSACSCRPDRSAILESLGFTSTPVLRRRPAPPPLPPVPTAVSTAVPVRSTTALVESLWEMDEPLGEFPPPVEPAIAVGTPRWGWIRITVTVLVLAAIGVGAHVGTIALLDGYADGIVGDARTALTRVGATASEVDAAAAAIADPGADAVALSAAAAVVTALEEDARSLRSLANPEPGWPDVVGLRVVDPIAGWRSAAGIVGERAGQLADELSAALTTRLLVEQLPNLPDLPNGADDATIDGIEAALAASITSVRSDLERFDPTLADDLGPVVDGWEGTSVAYVGALRSHDPAAEAYAGEVLAAYEVMTSVVESWIEGLGASLSASASGYRSVVASMG